MVNQVMAELVEQVHRPALRQALRQAQDGTQDSTRIPRSQSALRQALRQAQDGTQDGTPMAAEGETVPLYVDEAARSNGAQNGEKEQDT